MKFSLKSYKTLNNLCIVCLYILLYAIIPSFFKFLFVFSLFSDSLCVGQVFSF